MNRRRFFGALAAAVAAPVCAGLAPVARRVAPGPMITTGGIIDEFAARRRFAHECEWRDLPERVAQQCLVCGDVRSGIKYQQDVIDAHLDAVWGKGQPPTHVWGPAVKRLRPKTGNREDLLDIITN